MLVFQLHCCPVAQQREPPHGDSPRALSQPIAAVATAATCAVGVGALMGTLYVEVRRIRSVSVQVVVTNWYCPFCIWTACCWGGPGDPLELVTHEAIGGQPDVRHVSLA